MDIHDEIAHMKKRGFNHFVVAIGSEDNNGNRPILHLCGYPLPPTQDDVNNLIEELASDEIFEMKSLTIDVDYELHTLNLTEH